MDYSNSYASDTNDPVDPVPRPPPYKPQDSGPGPSPGMGYQVGQGGIVVVTPPGRYEHSLGGQCDGEAPPPQYSQGFQDDNCFSDAGIRRGFIRKVYLTLVIQLLLTVGIICAFLYWGTLRDWARETYWFSCTTMAVVVVLILAFSCCGAIRRKVPLNFIALGLFTVAEGLMLGSITVFYNAEAVLWAVGATALVAFSLSVFAMQSKFDFTMCNGCLWVLLWTLLSFSLLCAILRSQYVYIVYACLGTLIFSLYLVMDVQLIFGGKHKCILSPEEYIFASLNLYLDIIMLFILLLQFIRICR